MFCSRVENGAPPSGCTRRRVEPPGSPEGGTAGSRPWVPLRGSVTGGEGALPLCVRLLVGNRPIKARGTSPSVQTAGSILQHRIQGASGQGWAMAPGPSTLLSLGESGGAGTDSRGRGALLSPDSSPGDAGILGGNVVPPPSPGLRPQLWPRPK